MEGKAKLNCLNSRPHPKNWSSSDIFFFNYDFLDPRNLLQVSFIPTVKSVIISRRTNATNKSTEVADV